MLLGMILRQSGDNEGMRFQRSSGVLLHISSLPSYGGIGDLGREAYAFLDFLAAGHQHIWQVLPLCPVSYGNSPYSGSSAFAGNPVLISLERLVEWGWIAGHRLAGLPGQAGNVDFDAVERQKLPVLEEAASRFLQQSGEQWLTAQAAEFEGTHVSCVWVPPQREFDAIWMSHCGKFCRSAAVGVRRRLQAILSVHSRPPRRR